MQDIEKWLHSQHLKTTPAYLSDTAILTGRQLSLPPYQVVYRVEVDEIIICELRREPPGHCQPKQLFRLWRILREVFRHHPDLKQLRALVITDVLNAEQQEQRRRLQRVLIAQGASLIPFDDEAWMVLPAAQLLRRRAKRGRE